MSVALNMFLSKADESLRRVSMARRVRTPASCLMTEHVGCVRHYDSQRMILLKQKKPYTLYMPFIDLATLQLDL